MIVTPDGKNPPRQDIRDLLSSDTHQAGAQFETHAPPTAIGRFRVERVLGEGGFGRVYLARDQTLNRLVAIKVPHPARLANEDAIDLYLAEAQALASLDHSAIVPVYDAGRTPDGVCFVVSKFIEGADLREVMKNAPPPRWRAVEWVAQVADALHYAHKQGLVHRDIKPANILIDPEGKPHLVDFGLALREEDFGKGVPRAGTPSYMSPEQARGEGHRV